MLFLHVLASQIWLLALIHSPAAPVEQREWSDASGNYRFTAELIAWSDTRVVLQKENDDLISLEISDLSDADQAYIQTKKSQESPNAPGGELKTWVMRDGLRLNGRILDFAQRNIAIQRTLGKIYVNDRHFENLPPVYREMIPRIVSHFAKTEIEGRDGLDDWLKKTPLKTWTWSLEGVLLELEMGDRYVVPFFLFSDRDAAVLRSGWQRWQEAQEDSRRDEESFYLRAQAESYQEQQDTESASDIRQMRQIAEVSLQLQAYDAGLFDLWEVQVLPPNGSWAMPQTVVVPARDSRQASQAALQQFPGYRAGAIAKVRRR